MLSYISEAEFARYPLIKEFETDLSGLVKILLKLIWCRLDASDNPPKPKYKKTPTDSSMSDN